MNRDPTPGVTCVWILGLDQGPGPPASIPSRVARGV